MKRFCEPQPTLIIANGEKPCPALLKSFAEQASTIIALDGAADFLQIQNITPNLVIGDLDSATISSLMGLCVIKDADQETNDLEKALNFCLRENLLDVSVLGAFGLRMDHFLTNLVVMKRFAHHMRLAFFDDTQSAFICPQGQTMVVEDRIGSVLSLFPLEENVGPIVTTGLAYCLDHEFLSLSQRLGTLNRITAAKASIFCAQGDLLVLLPTLLHERCGLT